MTAICAGACLFPKNAKATQQIELRFSINWISCSPLDVLLKCCDIFHSFKVKQSIQNVNKRVLLYFKSYSSTSAFKTGERGSNVNNVKTKQIYIFLLINLKYFDRISKEANSLNFLRTELDIGLIMNYEEF